MKHEEYIKHRKINTVTYILSIVLKIILIASLIAFAVTFQPHSEISSFTIFYGRFILTPLIILLILIELYKTNSEKAKIYRRISEFTHTAQKQELTDGTSSEPFYKQLCTYYAEAKAKEWIEKNTRAAIYNFENDKALSLYSIALFEQDIKNNWEKYKGRTVSTAGFAFASAHSFTFIAYPFFDDLSENINSNKEAYFRIDEDKQRAFIIKYHQLVFRSNEQLVINQANEMINADWILSDNKLIEIDPGAKVILKGTLAMDSTGELTLTKCEIERNDIISRMNRQYNK